MITAKDVHKFSAPLHALYVEDDVKLRTETSQLLEPFFERLDLANDGLEGLQMFNEHLYDIIITDINMPRMNGIEMIQQIREINPEQKVLAISAHSDGDVLVKLIRAGVTSFILKPIIQQDVLNALYPVCRDAHTQRLNIELFEQLNEERAKLEKQIKILQTQQHATETKHRQVEKLLMEREEEMHAGSGNADAEPVDTTLIKDYFETDEDEGEENVLFLKDDCDEMSEMFIELPALMLQYNEDHNIHHIEQVVNYLIKISSVLYHYTPFLDPLAKSFEDLATVIKEDMGAFTTMFEGNPDTALMVWDAISIDMERYMKRFSQESMGMKNIHHIHHPTTLSIHQIIGMIKPDELDEGDIEFF